MRTLMLFCATLLVGCGSVDDWFGKKPRKDAPPVTEEIPPIPPSEKDVAAVLAKHCSACHGGGQAQGGFGSADNLGVLRRSLLVKAGKPDESPLYQRVANGTMPPPEVAQRPTELERALIRDWIQGGALVQSAEVAVALSESEIVDLIGKDRASVGSSGQVFYVTTHHLMQSRGSDAAELHSSALRKILNSTSNSSVLVIPTAIDERGLIVRIALRDLGWDMDGYQQIREKNPYRATRLVQKSKESPNLLATDIFYADWLVATLSRNPHYEKLLKQPAILPLLEMEFGLPADSALRSVMRAGFNNSQVADHHRVIERSEPKTRKFYYRSYEFGSMGQLKDPLTRPLGPLGETRFSMFAFESDGHEVIYPLRNGMLAFAVFNKQGVRLASAPGSNKTGGVGKRVNPGLDCMGCHKAGLIPKADQVRTVVATNAEMSDELRGEIERRYPPSEEFAAKIELDNRGYLDNLLRLKVDTKVDPVGEVVTQFTKAMTVREVAALLGKTEAELVADPGKFQKLVVTGQLPREEVELILSSRQ